MSQTFAPPQLSLDKLDAALGRLAARHGFCRISPAALHPRRRAGRAAADPRPPAQPRKPDVAAVLPEALASLKLGMLPLGRRQPRKPRPGAPVGCSATRQWWCFSDGAYLAELFSGIRNWAPFLESLARLVASQPRPPISIARA